MDRKLVGILAAIALVPASGCSIAASSASISKSISSPFKSSSASSSPEDEKSDELEQKEAKLSYSNDIRQLAVTYAESGGEIGALRSQVSKLAAARGLTNWETDALTCTSLAEGARAGGMTQEQQIAFSNEICPAQ